VQFLQNLIIGESPLIYTTSSAQADDTTFQEETGTFRSKYWAAPILILFGNIHQEHLMADSPDTELSRRGFLQRTLMAGTTIGVLDPTAAKGVPGTYEAAPQSHHLAGDFDLSLGSAALEPDAVVASACQFCNSLCRLNVHLKSGRIIDVVGEKNDPVQAGGMCVKGPMMVQLIYNRFRLHSPLKRVGGEKGSPDSKFEPISWEEATDTIAARLIALRDAGESHTIANKTSGRLPRGTGTLVNRFFSLLGSPNDTDVGPVCNDAGGDALAWTFGLGNFTNGYGKDGSTGKEDLGSSRFLLFFGTNQAETHPVTFAYLLRRRQRTGAHLTVVDPRLTPTGMQADEWIAPKPHTDLALVLGMLHHILASNLHNGPFVKRWVVGFEELRRHVLENKFSPEWAAGVSDVPAETIRRLAERYARTSPAAIFCNAGISHQIGAFDTYRAIAFLAAITGNIGIPGGGCCFMHNTWPGDLHLPAIATTVPKKREALPVGPDYFAEAILTGKPYPLKALITQGNPLIGSANTKKVQQAYRKLEFYVYTGLFMEESAYYADIILPACTGFEMETVYMRRDDRAIRWQKQAVPRVGASKPDWEIWIDLAEAMARKETSKSTAYWLDHFPAAWKDYRNLWAEFVAHTPGMAGMSAERLEKRVEPLRWPCPSPNHPGVSTLYLDHPSWYEAVKSLYPNSRKKRFPTPSGKVEIYTLEIDRKLTGSGHAALPVFYTHPEVTGKNPTLRYSSVLVDNPVNPGSLTPLVTIGGKSDGAVHTEYPLMGTTGRASVVHFAGMTHWTYSGKQMNGIRLIQLHPTAAAQYNISNGDEIVVENSRGSIRGTALLWTNIREDTIFIPNSFGPMQRMAEEFGVPFYEATNNLLDDRLFDNLSGQQAYKCFACRVRKAT
jgi:anaerobic selenocysteine-containing dehydrogenase